MSRLPPLHTYVDILEATRPTSPLPPPPPKPRSHMSIKQSLHASKSQSFRAIDKLPFEVLHQIFLFYFATGPIVYVDEPTSGSLTPGLYTNITQQLNPFSLSHVCAYWRAVISSIPEFWSSLVIIGPLYHQAYAIDTWLTRAGNRLTDIIFIQLDIQCAPHELEEATDQALAAVLYHTSYIQRLRLEFRCSEFQWSLSRLNPRQLHHLEAVHIEFPPWATPIPERDRLWANIFQAPKLYRVSWESTDLNPPLHLSRWQHLTWINIGGKITQYYLWSILKIAPRLVRLRARGIYNPTSLSPDITPLTHYSLLHLDLEFKSSPVQIYNSLKVPNLVSLRVAQNSVGYNPGNVAAPIRGLTRFLLSLSHLSNFTHLTILDPTIPEPLLLIFLNMKQLKNLVYLGLDYATANLIHRLNPSMLSSSLNLGLNPSGGAVHVFPKLRKLEVFNRYAEGEVRGLDYRLGGGAQEEDRKMVYYAVERLLKSRPKGELVVCLDPCGLVLDSRTLLII
ncbi:hypothetical protein D9756_008797 [Leucocoprinus leucothites]|uniref:F-box domain-containing protein n=1 Tax=Leucocoprinus leucothites TaxID=201217 RepID=A0A8H5CX59_9AGAR|nr:hypothetical protein D9756_008797 [Leucoagaricus leucothites]